MKLAPIVPTRRQDPFEDPEWGCDLKLQGIGGHNKRATTVEEPEPAKTLCSAARCPTARLSVRWRGLCARLVWQAGLQCAPVPSQGVDLLFYEREDIRPLPLKERRAILDQVQGNLLYSAMASGASTMEDASLASMSNGSPTAEL